MYDHFSGELDSKIAKLPESLQQPRVMDMVIGQYALVGVSMIWINEDNEVRLDGAAEIESEDSASPYDSYVYAVMLNEGIVLDLVERDQEKPIKLDKIALAKLMDEESFDLSQMIDVVWVVSTEREQDSLCDIYKEQTGQDLYNIIDEADKTEADAEVDAEVEIEAEDTAEDAPIVADATEQKTAPKIRRLFGRKKKMQKDQSSKDAGELTSSIEN